MKRALVIMLCLGFSTRGAFASSAGTTALPILQLGSGARGLALGGAYSALAAGSESLFWNPAGLASEANVDATLNHQPLMKVLTYDAGAVSWPMKETGLGLGYAQLASQSIDALDASGNSIGSVNTKDETFAAGAAHRWAGWQAGLAGRWIRSSVADVSASAWAVSLGLNSPAYAGGRMRHALTLRDIGGNIRYESAGEKLPFQAALGTSYEAFPMLRLTADVLQSSHGMDIAAGSEYKIPLVQERWAGFLRVGYTTVRRDLGSGLSLGGGLEMNGLRFDLAWLPMSDFGSSEVFTLAYRFSSQTVERPIPVSAPAPAPRKEVQPAPRKSQEIKAAPRPATPAESPVSAPAFKKTRVYVVKEGDTLARIAQRFYGNPQLWTVIYSANKPLIDDPKTLTVGQKILIPIGE